MTTSKTVSSNPTSRRDSAHRHNENETAETSTEPTWTLDQAKDLYGIQRWGLGYFGISASGNATVQAPTPAGAKTIEFSEILDGLKQRGLDMPVMLRFENLVDDRITQLHQGFASAIAQTNYESEYRGVFPIKVNQLIEVVEEIMEGGKPFGMGLEVGSKPELFAAMSLQDSPGSRWFAMATKTVGISTWH